MTGLPVPQSFELPLFWAGSASASQGAMAVWPTGGASAPRTQHRPPCVPHAGCQAPAGAAVRVESMFLWKRVTVNKQMRSLQVDTVTTEKRKQVNVIELTAEEQDGGGFGL